jgi:alpha-tubulin suppressor-like RCC1 family protein
VGNSTFTDSAVPASVPELTGVVAIAAGGGHILALKSDGTVWTWGHNGFGQPGNGTITPNSYGIATPAAVPGLTNITAISGGGIFSLALVKHAVSDFDGDGKPDLL